MTLSDARKKLECPRFGDPEAIKAKKLLAQVYEAVELADKNKITRILCRECSGEGEHECSCGDLHGCEECGGDGLDVGVDRDIFNEFSLEVLREADSVIRPGTWRARA